MLSAGISRKTAGSFLRRLLYGALLAALLVLAAALSAAAVPRLFGYGTVVVNGRSMGGSTPNGSLVVARWLAPEEVELGDVILFRVDGASGPMRPKLHRVVALKENGGQILVQTKGDANNAADPDLYILPDRVLTRAYALPYLGYLVGFVRTQLGWALLVALPATALGIVTLRGIWAGEHASEARLRRAQ